MKTLKDDHGPRDQGLSAFSGILRRLCESTDALGVALVDSEGETVDYAGRVDPFDMRVAAAELRLIFKLLETGSGERPLPWTAPSECVVRAARRTYAVTAFSEGYALVLILPRHAFRVSRRALSQTAVELECEAGLTRPGVPKERWRWTRIDVREHAADARRPEAVLLEGEWRPVTVLGRLPGKDLESLEIGFLARFASGQELLLVREPLGKWFSGDPL